MNGIEPTTPGQSNRRDCPSDQITWKESDEERTFAEAVGCGLVVGERLNKRRSVPKSMNWHALNDLITKPPITRRQYLYLDTPGL
jgi:hypothetical protein